MAELSDGIIDGTMKRPTLTCNTKNSGVTEGHTF